MNYDNQNYQLAEELHRTGETQHNLEREKISDAYDWLRGTEFEDMVQENTEEFLELFGQAYDSLHSASYVEDDHYSAGIAWDAAGEAVTEIQDTLESDGDLEELLEQKEGLFQY